MAATLTASPDPINGRVLITFTGATVGDTITRDGLPVRYPPITSTAGVLFDYEAQPGIDHTWVLSGGSVTATLGSGDCDGLWLTHPTNPSLSMKVKARWDQPQRWTSPGTVHEVMGNRPPLVTHTRRTYHTGTIEFWTPITAEAAVIALFEDGTPILVNPPACCTPVMRYEWTWGDLEARLAGDDVSGRSGWWWTYSYQRTITPSGHVDRPTDVANTYAGVLAEPSEPTYAALLTNHATYSDVLTTPHPHGATP